MKYLSLLFFTLTVKASIFEYKEVVRRYKNLEKLNLAACEQSYRHINENWMDCQFTLPSLINSSVGQIGNFHVHRRELTTAQEDGLDYFTRLETSYRDMDEASSVTKILVNSYYQRPGDPTIFSAPRSSYSYGIFEAKLRLTLNGWNPEGTTIVAYDPKLSSPFFDDEVKGSVLFGERINRPDAEKCLKNYEHDQEDNWPDDEVIFFSQCSAYEEKKFMPVYQEAFWSPKLKGLTLSETKIVPLSKNRLAKVTFSAEGVSIQLGNDSSSGPDFNLNLEKEEAIPLIREAAAKAGQMTAHFFVLERNAVTLAQDEKIIGKLVMKRTRMKDEIDLATFRY